METLAFDTAPLSHFARAGALDALAQLVEGYRCVATRAVRQELELGAQHDGRLHSALNLSWLATVHTDDLDVLYAFAVYMDRLGNRERNAGEASVLAWAEVYGAHAYTDDQVAYNVGRQRGVTVKRTLALVIQAYREGVFDEPRAQQLVDRLVEEDARFPQAARDDLFGSARANDLL